MKELERDSHLLESEGFTVVARQTERTDPGRYSGWVPVLVEVSGADHVGIINRITRRLAQLKANIESMDTSTETASMSGTPLFSMTAVVLLPPNLTRRKLGQDLDDVAEALNVDIEVSRYTGRRDGR
jgi:glycine cleavage system transcriptional repressor